MTNIFEDLFAQDALPTQIIIDEENETQSNSAFAFDDVFAAERHVVSTNKFARNYVWVDSSDNCEICLNEYGHRLALKGKASKQMLSEGWHLGTWNYAHNERAVEYTFNDGSKEIITETKNARNRRKAK